MVYFRIWLTGYRTLNSAQQRHGHPGPRSEIRYTRPVVPVPSAVEGSMLKGYEIARTTPPSQAATQDKPPPLPRNICRAGDLDVTSIQMNGTCQKKLIETSSQVKKALGNHLNVVRTLDPLPRQRRKTNSLRKRLVKRFGERCALCGSNDGIQAAHIVPLEIGSTTNINNLILLCRKHHSLYDAGHLSINSMIQVARDWRNGKSLSDNTFVKNLNVKAAITEPPESIRDACDQVLVLQRERKLKKASDLLKEMLRNPTLSKKDANYLFVKLAEITRRRDAQGALSQALSYINNVDIGYLHRTYIPVYYYESFYIHRLAGFHAKAQEMANFSAKASLDEKKDKAIPLGHIAASTNALLCELSRNEKPNSSQVRQYVAGLDKLEGIARRHGQYWGGRWALNCAAHRLQVYLKAKNEKSLLELKNLRSLYYQMDITTGWDSGSLQSICLLEGLTNVLFSKVSSEIEKGARLLARSFLSTLKRSQRFEGIRDAGFGLASSFRQLGKYSRTANILTDVINRTIDGTSYIWPWRAR